MPTNAPSDPEDVESPAEAVWDTVRQQQDVDAEEAARDAERKKSGKRGPKK